MNTRFLNALAGLLALVLVFLGAVPDKSDSWTPWEGPVSDYLVCSDPIQIFFPGADLGARNLTAMQLEGGAIRLDWNLSEQRERKYHLFISPFDVNVWGIREGEGHWNHEDWIGHRDGKWSYPGGPDNRNVDFDLYMVIPENATSMLVAPGIEGRYIFYLANGPEDDMQRSNLVVVKSCTYV